jgi:cell wall assembly regulator SMI1
MTSKHPCAILEHARSEKLASDNGEPLEVKLLPGLDDAEVRALEASLGTTLPPEIRELVQYARGFEFGPIDDMAFDGGFSFGMEEILPRAVPLCPDGFGNYWLVEVQKNGRWGPVFFANHDPPVLVVQSAGMGDFLDEVFALGRPSQKSAVDEVHDAASMRIWREDPWGKPAGDLRDAADASLREFAATLKEDDLVFDLRGEVVGSGFAWGRHGPDAPVKRHGDSLVFAVITPAKKPGFFGRLFGGSR